jgi:hypothetical protein
MSDDRPGYTDTPKLPHVAYRVHDKERPHPPTVDPDGFVAKSPPEDATVLFDGTNLEQWEHEDGRDPEWTVEDDYVEVTPDSGDIRTTADIGDCQLHLEWAAETGVDATGQSRSNSGVFMQDRYEIQVLDNYENPTYADGYAAGLYGQHPPDVNACREPGAWQSYDIIWNGPRFDGDSVVRPATVTVLHNGVVVQNATELIGPTTNLEVYDYEPHPEAGPVRLQDHGDRVRFRNVWYRPLE